MTQSDLILDIQNELTFTKALPYSLPEQEIVRIITNAERYFYDNWRHAIEAKYLLLPKDVFTDPLFKKERAIRLPDCIQFVHQVREAKGGSIFGTMDPDFADTKFIGSEIFLTPFIGESIMYRTVLFSFLDLTKAFTIDTLAYDYNKNTKKLSIMGRTPKAPTVLQVAKKIEPEELYEDELFQRFVRAKSKVRLGELLTTFDYSLPGGIKISYQTQVTAAQAELTDVLAMMKGENSTDWMYMVHF